MKHILVAVTLAIFSSSSHASPAFLVTTEITHKNQIVGSPTLRIAANSTASVKVAESYDYSVNLKVNDQDSVFVSTEITVAGISHSPSMLVALDQDASITIGDTTLSFTIAKQPE